MAIAESGDCTVAGDGSASARAAWGLATACNRVATLVGETSLDGWVWRTAAETGSACRLGLGIEVACALRATLVVLACRLVGAGCETVGVARCGVAVTSVVCGVGAVALAGRSTGVLVAERATDVGRDSKAGCCGVGCAVAPGAAAVVFTSGREVTRGRRLGTGLGDWATFG